ncbi:unnamed protein product [Oppiella nova]|uniref:Uncharacterized protein n=1 Tax=Oppiella nova TaxID=334625 RepID=A0A7R9LBY4_9ACAR|nr:unnamed protein product [Oppiella nova]CAG2162033.1 unnamed protein product [Oppiella nova]
MYVHHLIHALRLQAIDVPDQTQAGETQYLPMPGIRVDLSRSGPHSVFLKNINLSSAGVYSHKSVVSPFGQTYHECCDQQFV